MMKNLHPNQDTTRPEGGSHKQKTLFRNPPQPPLCFILIEAAEKKGDYIKDQNANFQSTHFYLTPITLQAIDNVVPFFLKGFPIRTRFDIESKYFSITENIKHDALLVG